MLGQQRFVIAEVAVDQPLHQLVALRIQAAIGVRLRDAIAQLAVAEIVVGRHRDLLRRGHGGLGGVVPIHVDLVEVDAVVLEDLHELRAAGRHHDVGRARRRKTLAVEVGIEHEDAAVDHHALLGGGQTLQHLWRSAMQSCFCVITSGSRLSLVLVGL